MNKTILKIFSIIIISIIMISMSTNAFATTLSQMQPNQIEGNKTVAGSDTFTNVGADVVGIIRAVGIVLSVAIVSVLGIKYMMGSAEERASYKKSMLPYIIGAIMLFAASNLAEIIYQFSTGVEQQITHPMTNEGK